MPSPKLQSLPIQIPPLQKPPLQSWPLQKLVILSFLIVGSLLRLLWAGDMEWKSEEQWMFEQAQKIASGAIPLPSVGMPSSVGLPNPGMSVYCFALIAKVAHDPIAMVRWIQGLNILALWGFVGFVLWQIARDRQAPWLWGLALHSVNPLAILFSRKIWTPDWLTPFCYLIFLGHWFKQKFWGAFLWGVFGTLVGQVQMGGFFFALGLMIWTIWQHWRRKTLREISWLGWLLGTGVGLIPMLPWIWTVAPHLGEYRRSVVGLLVPKFYLAWSTTALGINLSYSLKESFWQDFLQEPLILGVPTYLMIPCHLFLLGVGLQIIYRFFQAKKLARERAREKLAIAPTQPDLIFYLKALAFGVGGVFTLSGVNFRYYYIPVVFPFVFIWLAWLYRHQIRLLATIALLQLLISSTFLVFIHRTGGSLDSDYGITYQMQVEQQKSGNRKGNQLNPGSIVPLYADTHRKR